MHDTTHANVAPPAATRCAPVVNEGWLDAPGGVRLYHRSVRPPEATPTRARLGVVHGYGEHLARYERFFDHMARRGVACHAMDFRGHGRSSGRRGFVSRWENYLDDLRSLLALPDLRRAPDQPPLFILGHSHGGLVAAMGVIEGIIPQDGGVAGCLLGSPFFANAHPVPLWKRAVARVLDPVCPWARVKSGLSQDWMSSDPDLVAESRADPLLLRCATPRFYLGMLAAQPVVMRRAGEFRLPLLTLLGEADPLSDLNAIREFHSRAGSSDKALIAYPGLRHELLREADRLRVFADVLQWIERRLPRR